MTDFREGVFLPPVLLHPWAAPKRPSWLGLMANMMSGAKYCLGENYIKRNLLDWKNLGGDFLSGNYSESEFSGWELSGWEFSWWVLSRWDLSWVETFRMGIVRWESSRLQYPGWEFSQYWKTIRYLLKSTYQPTQAVQKEGCSCNLCIPRNEEFQFMWQQPYSKQSQMSYSTWRTLT